MSLLDSLLLDPHKLDVWIALRTDGVKGSGTEEDPYDGSTRATPIISVTITRSGATATATATNHGFKNGDRVLIAGATGDDAKYYNGTFSIFNVDTNTFQYTMWGTPAASATGTITCRLDPYMLDAVMSSLPASPPLTVHIGPGVFETKGFSPSVTGGWQPKSGQKIIGSGMGVTTLKLVNTSVAYSQYWLIGTGVHLEYFEASDLTLDCNLDGQSIPTYTFPPIACSGIIVSGAHLGYRRVRVINFGDLTSAFECFVMWSAGADPNHSESVDCVIEDCILEQPAINQFGLVTLINMGATERPTDGVMGYHRACVVRNCVVDCEFKVNPVAISQITYTIIPGPPQIVEATVTTQGAHGRAVNDWVRVSGALVNASASNPFNGSFKITAVPQPNQFKYQHQTTDTPASNPVGDMWVDRFSSHYVPITNIGRTGTGPHTITVTTATPHFRVPGNNAFIQVTSPDGYSGSFEVTDVPNSTQFQFVLNTDPGPPTAYGFIGMGFQGLSNDGGTAAVLEGNRIFNTRIGGPYHDSFNTKDLIVRNNHYRSVVTGPYQFLGGPLSYSRTSVMIPLVSLDRSGTTGLAQTTQAHGFSTGPPDKVIISGVTGPTPQDAGWYNGEFPITAVPDSTHFQYGPMGGTPSGAATGSPAYSTDDRQKLLASLTYALETGVYVATAQISTAYSAHGFAIGDAVRISKATGQLDQAHNDLLNGYHTITAVPNATAFKYALADNPNPPNQSGSSPSSYYGRLWQAGRLVFEDNIIELVPTPTNWGPPYAIFLGYWDRISPPLFRQVVVRGNVIRHVDGFADPPGMVQGNGISISGCAALVVEENVIDLDKTNPIEYSFCDNVRFFSNRTSSGTLIQGVDTNNSSKASELMTDIEDAALLGF